MSERDEQQGDGEIAVCQVCGQAFDTQLALAEHLMKVHEALPDTPNEPSDVAEEA